MALAGCKKLHREGKTREALEALRKSLRERGIAPEKLDAAGRFVASVVGASASHAAERTVLILGQCTTSYLKHTVTAVAFSRDMLLRVEDGAYDNVMQDLSNWRAPADVVIFVPWSNRLLTDDDRSEAERIDDEVTFFAAAWVMARQRGMRIVQVGYDSFGPGAAGYGLSGAEGGGVRLVRRLNEALRAALPQGAYFLDLEQVASSMGRRAFYDARGYHWTKQPFSWPGLELLSRHLCAGVRAVTTGPKKVLVLDLDNTLWGGVVGEDGPHGIAVADSPEGEAFRAMQRYCKELSRRGVVLAACSKNSPDDAREPFERNSDMLLALSDFAAFEASWDPKSVALQRISAAISLPVDSFVFFDDNPAERAEVRARLPEVEVVEAPEDPADFVSILEDGLYFESVAIGDADVARTAQYQAESRRRQARELIGSLETYLESLDMVASVRAICDDDMPRVTQLLGKTNQFNLTTRRHGEAQVRRLLSGRGGVGLTVRLQDRFGDYGLVGVVIGVADPSTPSALCIDTFLMSCRAMGRTLEHYLFNRVTEAAKAEGYRSIVGEFIPTTKNAPVADIYARFGFEPLDRQGSIARFILELDEFEPLETYVGTSTRDER